MAQTPGRARVKHAEIVASDSDMEAFTPLALKVIIAISVKLNHINPRPTGLLL